MIIPGFFFRYHNRNNEIPYREKVWNSGFKFGIFFLYYSGNRIYERNNGIPFSEKISIGIPDLRNRNGIFCSLKLLIFKKRTIEIEVLAVTVTDIEIVRVTMGTSVIEAVHVHAHAHVLACLGVATMREDVTQQARVARILNHAVDRDQDRERTNPRTKEPIMALTNRKIKVQNLDRDLSHVIATVAKMALKRKKMGRLSAMQLEKLTTPIMI
jgi:hypothetical protein